MKLTNKIRMLFLLAILVPIVIFLILSYQVCTDYLSLLKSDDSAYFNFWRNHHLSESIYDAGERLYKEVSEELKENPYILENQSYLETLQENTDDFFSYIIIFKNNQSYYHANIGDCKTVEKMLRENEEMFPKNDDFYYISDLQGVLIRDIAFGFRDGGKGEFFILTDMNQAMIRFTKTFFIMMFLCIGVIIFMALMLTLLLHRDFMKPIEKLEEYMKRMREGDLDSKIAYNKENEIGHLAQEVDELRATLKETLDENLLHEENDRMILMNISHDLKTPLTTIKGYAEGIRDGVAATPEKMNHYTEVIVGKVDEMTALVDQILFQSHLEYNVIVYDFCDVDAIDYFKKQSEELQSLILEKDGSVEIFLKNHCKKSSLIHIDTAQIGRVLVNLYSNAVKYNDKEKKQIDIILYEDTKQIIVEFRDNGMGIPKKNLDKIFDRFYRIDTARNSTTGGSGLGLSIVKKIIREHKGEVWAESRMERGSSIFFTLPKSLRL